MHEACRQRIRGKSLSHDAKFEKSENWQNVGGFTLGISLLEKVPGISPQRSIPRGKHKPSEDLLMLSMLVQNIIDRDVIIFSVFS